MFNIQYLEHKYAAKLDEAFSKGIGTHFNQVLVFVFWNLRFICRFVI